MLRDRVLHAITGTKRTAAEVAEVLNEPPGTAGSRNAKASAPTRVLPILNELAIEGIALREIDTTGIAVARWSA